MFSKCYASLMLTAGSFFLLSIPSLAAIIPIESFEDGNLSNWIISPSGQAIVTDNSFGVSPTDGNFQALLETGETGISTTPVFNPFLVPNTLEGTTFPTAVNGFLFDIGNNPITDLGSYVQGSAIKYSTQLMVSAGDILHFDYNFLTDETNSIAPNNDLAFFSINQTLIPVTSVNTATFVSSPTAFTAETNYQPFSYVFTNTEMITLSFAIVDENATSGHSALLVDNIRLQTSVNEPASIGGLLLLSGLWIIGKASSVSKYYVRDGGQST
ncbi:MAG: PEP-CTERM sorting domain-containing protein [Microcystaceae cyanobacterium]